MSNIVVKEVSKSFDDAEVLHDINLEFNYAKQAGTSFVWTA